ncbi:MAG: helix-turn-helix domain-containing protein [bacterium]
MNTQHLLTKFGLTKNESAVYTALVKLVEASAYAIAKETKIPKTTIYEVLDSLKERGFISKSLVNGSAYYTAESANRFLTTANEKLEIAKLLIPSLESIRHEADKNAPNIKFYIGVEGVKKAFEDVLITLEKSNNKVIHAVADQEIRAFLPRYMPSWLEKREKMGIFTYLLTYPDPGETNEPELFKNNNLRETRLIPKDFILNSSMDIYGSKVVFFSHRDNIPHAVIIDSENITETIKKFFQFMWKFAEIPNIK